MSDAVAVARALRSLHAGIVTPDYEKLLCQSYHRFLWSNPSAVILDVGAHAGFHLDYFSRLIRDTGHVIAFEPLPHLAAALSQRYRGHRGIEIRAVALGREQGTASFHFVKELTRGIGAAATCIQCDRPHDRNDHCGDRHA